MGGTTYGYCRISKDRTGQSAGVTRQEADIRALAERLGLPEPIILTDNDQSAVTGARPAMARLRADLAAGRVSVLLAWSQDRLGRSVAEWEELLGLCRVHGVRLVTVTDGEADAGTVGGRLTTRVRAVVAQSEVEQKSERQLAAARHAAANGKSLGKPGWGFRRVRDIDGRGMVVGWRDEVDPVAAPIIRECADRLIGGESLQSVVRWLDGSGVPTPSGGTGWHPSTLRSQLLSPRMVGDRVHRGAVVAEAEAGGVLDRGVQARLAAVLTDPARRSSTDTRARHLLTGVGRCAVCGGKVNFQPRKKVYVCRQHGCFAVPKQWADDRVARIVCWALAEPAAAGVLVGDDAAAAAVASGIAEAERSLVEARDAVAAGLLPVAALVRIEAGVGERLAELRGRLRAVSSGADLSDIAGYFDAAERWAGMTVVRRREVLAAVLSVVRFHPQGRHRDPSGVPSGSCVELVWSVAALDPGHSPHL